MYDSHAVIVGETMYIYGCIGLDPTSATLVSGGIEPETEQVSSYGFVLYCLHLLWFILR